MSQGRRFRSAAFTLQGDAHAENQDSFLLLEPESGGAGGCLAVVADGVGSTPEAGRAGRIACDSLAALPRRPSVDRLLDLVEAADAEVRLMTSSACTLTGLWLWGQVAWSFHLGDSVVLRHRASRMERLTPSQKRGGGLVSYVGMGSTVRQAVDMHPHELKRGDRFLVASDGLLQALDQGDVEYALSAGRDAAEIASELERLLRARALPDDVTAICIDIVDPDRGDGRLTRVVKIV